MSKTLIVTCALLIMVIFTEGCVYVKKKKRSKEHIHKYSGKKYINVNKWKNNE